MRCEIELRDQTKEENFVAHALVESPTVDRTVGGAKAKARTPDYPIRPTWSSFGANTNRPLLL